MTTKTRLLAALLAFCCVFGSVPALAAETTESTQDASVISDIYQEEAEDATDDILSSAEEDTAAIGENVYFDEELTTEDAAKLASEEEQAAQTEDAQTIAPEDEDPLAFGHVGAQEDAQAELYDSNGVSRKFVDGTIGKTTTYSFLTNKTYSVPVGYNILHGIDVSRYNTSINWTAVKKAGVDFAIIRVGYRGYGDSGTLCEDSYYKTNLKNATAAGIPVGVYIFSQALTTAEARAEANFVISRIKSYNVTLPVVMDYEFAGTSDSRLVKANLTKAEATNNCLAFIDTVKKAGYEPMVYANKNYLTNNLNASTVAAEASIWLANYTTNTTYSGEYDYWQYAEDGYLSACSGNGGAVDANFLFTKQSTTSNSNSTTTTVSGFKDVSSSAWYASAVEYVAENEIMVGTSSTTFEPSATVTRAMAAKIMYNLAGSPSVSGSNSFADVSSGSWYSKAVTWAQKNGIMGGYSTTKFGPNDILTREQLATVLYRYAAYSGKSVSASASLSKFSDSGSVSSFASTAMKWAVANGVINGSVSGSKTLLLPKGKASRAECAQVMMNYLSGVGN